MTQVAMLVCIVKNRLAYKLLRAWVPVNFRSKWVKAAIQTQNALTGVCATMVYACKSIVFHLGQNLTTVN